MDDLWSVGPFLVGDLLGHGSFTKVRVGIHQETHARAALKMISLQELECPNVRASTFMEIQILRHCVHPSIVQIFDVYLLPTSLVLVLECVDGIELYDHLVRTGKIDEVSCRRLFLQLLDLVEYLHSAGIAHRDLKPENILLVKDSDQIKLVDFGLGTVVLSPDQPDTLSVRSLTLLGPFESSQDNVAVQSSQQILESGPWREEWSRFGRMLSTPPDYPVSLFQELFDNPNESPAEKQSQQSPFLTVETSPILLKTRCGSEEYSAPELYLKHPYHGGLADIWSLGVILFVCLTGRLPFTPQNNSVSRLQLLFRGQIAWGTDQASAPAKELVQGMLQILPEDRWSVDRIKSCSWLNQT